MHTGLPTITIPLWQLKQGDITVETGLSYHGGGIKVDEIASWVGTGWALQAGGAITRSSRGLPDDPAGYAQVVLPQVQQYIYGTMTGQARKNYVMNLSRGLLDAEPDVYHISVGGITARFFIGDNGDYIIAPRELNLQLAYNVTEADGKHYYWVVTDAKGIRYKFGEAETNEVSTIAYSDGIGSDGSYSGLCDSSWFLTEIEDTKGNQIRFAYAREGSTLVTKASEYVNVPSIGATIVGGCTDLHTGFQTVFTSISSLRLTSITNGREKVVFVPDRSVRQDQNGYGLALVQVQYDGQIRKQFRLYKSYFANEPIGTRTNPTITSQDKVRLRLDSLREEAVDTTHFLPAYRFTYNPQALPYRNSLAQDHWGFYNGQDNTIGVTYQQSVATTDITKGAVKEPDPRYAAAALLTAIRYPTGGDITFTYEPNEYLNSLGSITKKVQLLNFYGVSRSDSLVTRFRVPFDISADMASGGIGGEAITQSISHISPEGPANGYTIQLRIVSTDTGPPVSVPLGGTQGVSLRAGHYALVGEIETEFITDPENGTVAPTVVITCALTAQVTYPSRTQNLLGPGLRLKQLKKHFGGAITESRSYEYEDSTAGASSGRISNLPQYKNSSTVLNDQTYQPYCLYTTYSSVSHYPLVNSAAGYVGYGRVIEYYDVAKSQGKKVYTYTNFDTHNDINSSTSFPFVPASSQDWKRGLPLTEEAYESISANRFVLQEKTRYRYSQLPYSFVSATGLKVAGRTTFVGGSYDLENYFRSLSAELYSVVSDSYQLESKTTTHYEQGKEFTTIEARGYTPQYFQLQKIHQIASDGTKSIQRWYYPTDYSNNRGAVPLLDGLLARNMLNVAVEELVSRQRGTQQLLTAGVLHHYASRINAANKVNYYESRQYRLNTTRADTTQRYDFLHIPGHYEEQLRVLGVNSRNAPTAYRLATAGPASYQWGYNDCLPIASCQNATVNEFFYEGFEETSNASIGYAHSGIRYKAGNYNVTWTPPNTRTYILSYWYRQAGSWRYHKQFYNGPSASLAGGDAYDDVRIVPQDALLTTYTYTPLIGVTSQTDPTDRMTSYKYDEFNRLVRTRDEQGRILSQQQYHYAGAK